MHHSYFDTKDKYNLNFIVLSKIPIFVTNFTSLINSICPPLSKEQFYARFWIISSKMSSMAIPCFFSPFWISYMEMYFNSEKPSFLFNLSPQLICLNTLSHHIRAVRSSCATPATYRRLRTGVLSGSVGIISPHKPDIW